jgi:hypothetical protein
MNRELLEQQLAEMPLYVYLYIDPQSIEYSDRIRWICQHECPMYGKTWACPPGVGEVADCAAKCRSYQNCLMIGTITETADISNMEETLKTRPEHEKLTKEEFIRRHSANLCYVYFQAFAISHSYVGSPVKQFTVPRRESPRTKIPRGSIAMWADQTVLNGYDLPCGWQVIGRTPVILYDEARDPASYCHSGQWVKFVPIDAAEYARIRKLALAGEYVPKVYEREDG